MTSRTRIDIRPARDVFLENVVLDCPRELAAFRSRPRAAATYSASKIDAVALIVIEVEIMSSGIPSNNRSMSSIESIATPTLPTSPSAVGSSESYPICVGRSKATDSPVCRSRAETCSGRCFFRVAHARVLPHRPQPPAVHGGLDAARKGKLPGKT